MRIFVFLSGRRLFPVCFWCQVFLLFFICIMGSWSLVFPPRSQAASVSEIKKNIVREKERALAKKKALSALSSKERARFRDLATIEDRMLVLERQVAAQKQKIGGLFRRESRLRKEYQAASLHKERLRKGAENLLQTFWPIFLERKARMHFGSDESWARSDREATWLSVLYAEIGKKLVAVYDAREQAWQALERLQETRKKREQKIQEVTNLQEDLLRQRFIFFKDVQKIRSRELDLKEQLDGIASTISALHYKLRILDTHSFPKLKGYLPWPAEGRLVKRFHPCAKSPQRGISLALTPHHKIRAVSWGKVVHDGQLRGFGRVIILYHGKDYYSLYAFLATSRVRFGQKVEKGEILGECGFYPLLKTSGLYFELRFHQKAINPLQWLQSRG